MKQYLKFLVVAAVGGVVCILGYTKNVSEIALSEMLLLPAFRDVDCSLDFFMDIIYWMVPLVLFQIFYGTFIYRHFCCASIYFFSRNCNRSIWFIKEAGMLFLLAVLYLFVFLVGGGIATAAFLPITIDGMAGIILIYYIIIYALFLTTTTLLINILAVLFTSNVAFCIVEGVVIAEIASFLICGELAGGMEKLLQKYMWMIKANPFVCLLFGVHSSRIDSVNHSINKYGIVLDLNYSVGMYLIFFIGSIIFGCIVVNKYNFINSDREVGGS